MNGYKRIFKRITIVNLCILFILGSGITVGGEIFDRKVRVAIPIHQEHFRNDGKCSYSEYTYDYLEKISQYTNWKYEFVELEGDDSEVRLKMLEMLEKGEVDIAAPMEMRDVVLESYDLTGLHYGMTYSTLSVLTENTTASEADYRTLDSLNIAVLKSDKETIAELKRFCYSNDITFTLIEYESEKDIEDAIRDGSADAVLGINTSPMEDTRILAKFAGVPHYFATKKGNFEIMNGLNRAMNEIHKTDPCFSTRLNKKYFSDEVSSLILTKAEEEYIAQSKPLTVLSMEGIASLRYKGDNDELWGISRHVLEKVADMTGLVFNYKVIETLDKIPEYEEADIVCSIPYNYAVHSFPEMLLSQPFLNTSTTLYLHSSINGINLENKIYAAVRGSGLPEGVKEENAIYFNTREESINAVNSGLADYGYGNSHSVAFYMTQNGYENIVSIPQEGERREYSIGFINGDKLLASIINKSLGAIDEKEIQSLVLDITFHMKSKATPSMILNAYGRQIRSIICAVIVLLIYGIICNLRANIKLKMQNRRYEVLAEISNEYLYEYDIKKDVLKLSDKCIQLLGSQKEVDYLHSILKSSLINSQLKSDDTNNEVKLMLSNGETGIFKIINLGVDDQNGHTEAIIGKLIDISEDVAEKEDLVIKAQRDGLTGLYNPITSRKLIVERISQGNKSRKDALILLDVDLFKDINDRLGHYIGDQALQDLANDLKENFRSTDIIGRIGGDEFCIYMMDIPSIEFVQMKCKKLNDLTHSTKREVRVSVSMGITIVDKEDSYKSLFERADYDLYRAKHNGGGQSVVFEGEEKV